MTVTVVTRLWAGGLRQGIFHQPAQSRFQLLLALRPQM